MLRAFRIYFLDHFSRTCLVAQWLGIRLPVQGTWVRSLVQEDSICPRATTLMKVKSLSCVQLCDPMDCNPPGSSIQGIFQARVLEWVAISFSNAWKWKVKVKLLGCVQLFTTPWTAAYQAPPSRGFSRQEYWSGVPLPSLVHMLLKSNLKDLKHYFASMWNEHNCIALWAFFGIALFGDWNENWTF